MKGNVGVWIDHREAVIVAIDDTDHETVSSIQSNVKSRTRLAGGSRGRTPYAPQDVAKEQKRDHRFQHHLNKYYDCLIEILREADAIWVFGPGEAKNELWKKIENIKCMAGCLAEPEAAEKMTVPQIRAKVRGHYKIPNRIAL
jgi:stalled ribosome rescue protein Dom34